MHAPPSVNIARLLYILVCEAAGLALALSTRGSEAFEIPTWLGLVGGLVVAAFFILVEVLIKGFTLRGFATATFGLLVGVFCAFLLSRVGMAEVLASMFERELGAAGREAAGTLSSAISLLLYASLGFLGAVLALRSNRDDFAFILPYVRFRQDGASGQPVVLDAGAIIDGRAPGVVAAGFLTGRLIVPRFVLDELEERSRSPVQSEREPAKRGIDLLDKMQDSPGISVSIEEARGVSPDEAVSGRLLQMAQLFGARLMTTDENLGRVAKLRGVDVLNLNELLEALKPTMVVGEKLRLALVRPGKDDHQAVGYLADGTMIVVNHAADRIGTTQDVVVISKLQTSAGQMVFAELAG